MDVSTILVGAGVIGIGYFLYLCATKGLPAAWAWLKAKVTAGKAEITKLETDLVQLETGAVADLKNRVSAIEAHVGITAPAPAPIVMTTATATAGK